MSPEDTPAEGQEPAAEAPEPKPQEGGFDSLPEETRAEIKRLRADTARYRREAQEAKAAAQQYEDRDKSELEKLSGKLAKQEQATKDAEAALIRFEVAAEKQVPPDALDLLVGNTREELEARADKIVELARTASPPPEFDGGARDPAPEPKTAEQAHSDLLMGLFGRQPNQ